jgi:hypothetical protein
MLGHQLADVIGCWCGGVPRQHNYRAAESTIASAVAELEEATGDNGSICSGRLVSSLTPGARAYEQSLTPFSPVHCL